MIRNAAMFVAALFGCGAAFANTCQAPILAGATNQTVYVEFIDNTTGLPVTGLVWNGSGIDLEYVRTGAAAVNLTEATQTAAGAHSDGGFVDVGYGRYRLDLPDAAVAASAREVVVQGILTGYTMLPCVVALSDGTLEAVRADTINLPDDPADDSDLDAQLLAIDNYIDSEIATIVTATLAASIRTAVGLASANMDTQFAGVESGITYNAAWDAEIQSEVADALAAIFLDQLLANTYNPASPPGASDSLLEDLVENGGGVTQFNANALEDAPTGAGESLSAIAEAVWEYEIEAGVSAQCSEAAQLAEATGNYIDIGQVRTFFARDGSTARVIGTMALDGTARTATSVSCVGL